MLGSLDDEHAETVPLPRVAILGVPPQPRMEVLGKSDVVRVGDIYVSRFIEGVSAYRKILAYQTRELVDLRKLVYMEENIHKVGWRDYKRKSIDWTDIPGFKSWYADYEARFKGVELHNAFGFMNRRGRGPDLAKLFGGETHYDDQCPCDECDTWERISDIAEFAAPNQQWIVEALAA